MPYTITKLSKRVGVSICTIHRHINQQLLLAVWSRIESKDKRGRRHVCYGWLISNVEAKRYEQYLESLVGFRSDGKLPSKKIIEMYDKAFTVDEIARESKTKPANVKRAITQELKRRKKWQAQNSSQTAQT